MVFNLDPSVSNEELRQISGVYGEVKEVIKFSLICVLSLSDLWDESNNIQYDYLLIHRFKNQIKYIKID